MIKNWGSYVVEAVYKLEIHEYIAFVIVMLYIIIAYMMNIREVSLISIGVFRVIRVDLMANS